MCALEDIPLVDVVSVEPLEGHLLALEFEDGKKGVFDMNPYLALPAWRSLNEPDVFKQACVASGTVVWPGDIDMAPDRLYTDMVQVEMGQGTAA